ncbi:hypothetical protein F2Q68_00018060 [Brassica cretica]|uniref:S-acyltransferase n=1 Tax=Brassica cretica TaxID=69181 RepID=A0A8S9HHS0_BRACR|nr:hypothetical protein F2Q68_00018060 [Brassica cretica]
MKRKGVGFSLPVAVVMMVIGFVYFSTVFTFIDRWFSLTSSPGIANAAAFTALALMCVYSYSIAVFRDPGRVPISYMPDVEDQESPVHEIKRKILGPNVLSWLCPTSRHIGSGLRFRSAFDYVPVSSESKP